MKEPIVVLLCSWIIFVTWWMVISQGNLEKTAELVLKHERILSERPEQINLPALDGSPTK